MAVRTHIYPFDIVLPEVIEDIEKVPKEYLELLEEVLDHLKESSCKRVHDVDFEIRADFVMCCPICGFDGLHVPAIVLVTSSTCVITTKKGTKVFRSEGLRKLISKNGWRLVMFCECERGHATKIIYHHAKGRVYLLYYEMDKRKFKAIIKTEHFDDIDRD